MTLSSSMRSSSKRDFRLQNHKRGHSFDSGLTIKLKEDDLVLFSDMQMRESENFLLNSSDDFDDSLAKLKYSSDFKLNIPVRGESNDLLNVGSEKNDYDWLLTPPETPLFSSLDDEDLASANLVSRGRPRAQPIPISTSSSTGKGHRAGRSSASPSRSSPSPRSGNKQPQLRGRPSSARSASPAVVLHPTTPSRRSTTPQNRPSTPTPRSSTPTHRRTSSGSSSSVASFGRTGTSPVKASRGNSASPKLREWQMSFPGLPSEPPPNLRTSLSDRSASHARDSSPLSRNGRKVSLKSSRQSISPTASRSVSSSQSNDRDHFSSRSKGSVTSSCDDDVDITYPVNVGFSSRPTLRNNGNFASSRNTTISKKPSRTITSDLAPKGSFSADHRHMDQCRTPHNMFRPLLSSVHHSSFHTAKSNTMHRPLFSWNSSLTTSSNASSDQGASVAPDTEGSDHDQNDLVVEWDTIPNAEVQDEIFKLDEADRTEDIGDKVNGVEPKTVPGEFDKRTERNTEVKEIGQQSYDLDDKSCGKPSSEFPCPVHDFSEVECTTALTVCSKYNESFQTFEISDVKVAICQKCIERHENVMDGTYTPGFPETVPHISQNLRHHQSVNAFISELSERSHLGSDVPQISEINNENFIGQLQKVEPDSKYSPDASPIEFCRDEKSEQNLRDELEFQNTGENFQQFHPFGSCQKSRICSPEGAGISVLLERSSSSKGLVIQGRPLTAASVCCVEPSSIGNSVNISKSIPAWASSTESSSVNVLHSTGESTVAVHGPGGSKSRSLTLEEARDSILFCSSIIHDLAFKAAVMAIEKEDSLSTQEINLPAVMLLGKSTSEERNQIRSRQTAKPKQTKRKSSEAEAMPPSAEPATSVKIPEEASSVGRPKPPNKLDSMKPPKLESKCNCTVM
ncbi:unnamed protein product [Spirodela intermedia]|uniref:Uncharacterized protein n=1 Tax=Spirodela intermedia TaxID=51605 RepID=A0A7I8JCI4_SPIIN|nr:unnamed protein product [Spirodela intermedia]CAA6667819.1 unnamed protein product [Spirodela intermedia]